MQQTYLATFKFIKFDGAIKLNKFRGLLDEWALNGFYTGLYLFDNESILYTLQFIEVF
jgi:hypothetical protein